MIDIILDSLFDTLKILPFLFVAFLVLEFIEHRLNKKSEHILNKNKKLGPIFGGLLGSFPQCGFSTIAANLYSKRVITIGTLIAIFLSTSDEMLPIMLGNGENIFLILSIIATKVVVGIISGLLIDLILKKKLKGQVGEIKEMCTHDHCDCKKDGIFLSSLKHALKIGFFVLIANLLIGFLLALVGTENLSNLLLSKNILTYFLAGLVGLIPNCASSVILTELFMSNLITIGTLLTGLLAGSGLGTLILFKTNKNWKENLWIVGAIYCIGLVIGIIVDFII